MFEATNKILIFGCSGCGKSFLSKKIQSVYPRVWVIDTLEEYTEKDGYVLVNGFNAFSAKCLEIKKTNAEKYKIAVRLDPENENLAEVYNEIIKALYYLEDCLVVTEEIQEFTTPHKMPHWLKRAILTGRHRKISLMWTTQRVGYANKTLASQCAHVFAGRIFENNDVEYLKKLFGDDAEKLKDLKERFFFHWQPGKKGMVLVKNTLTK